jgi:lysozyme family protein
VITDVDRAWEFVHEAECGGRCRLVSHPQDPGGDTIHGIARNAHPAAWADGPPSVDAAHKLFEQLYWRPAGCDAMPWPLSLAMADFAFHSGVRRARRMLARVAGDRTDFAGLGVISACDRARELLEHRRNFLRGLSTFAHFGRGWMARCDRLAAAIAAAEQEGG